MGQGIQEWTKYNLSLPFTNFIWYILEYFGPNILTNQFNDSICQTAKQE